MGRGIEEELCILLVGIQHPTTTSMEASQKTKTRQEVEQNTVIQREIEGTGENHLKENKVYLEKNHSFSCMENIDLSIKIYYMKREGRI